MVYNWQTETISGLLKTFLFFPGCIFLLLLRVINSTGHTHECKKSANSSWSPLTCWSKTVTIHCCRNTAYEKVGWSFKTYYTLSLINYMPWFLCTVQFKIKIFWYIKSSLRLTYTQKRGSKCYKWRNKSLQFG